MKKIFCLLTLLLILGACAQGTVGEETNDNGETDEVAVETAVKSEEEMDVAEDIGLDTQDVSSPKDTEEGVRTVVIPDLSVKLSFPDNYTLSRITERNRRGSFTAYRFKNEDGFSAVDLNEIQFFSEDSIREFTKDCDPPTSGQAPCFFGDYPTVDRYREQKEAFYGDKDYYEEESFESSDTKKFELKKIDSRKYFLTTHRCVGDYCMIREYTTFLEDMKVDMSIMMSESIATKEDVALRADEADKLFEELKIEAM